MDIRKIALALLDDCFADEIAHLRLRIIRDDQAPRFESLKETYPEIYADFTEARTGPHEILLENRRRRVEVLTKLIEGKYEDAEGVVADSSTPVDVGAKMRALLSQRMKNRIPYSEIGD